MASRRNNYPENWSPVPQKISTRPANYEPREARGRLTNDGDRALRPKPLNLPSKQPQDSSVLKSVQSLRKESTESYEGLRDPEIVDVGSTAQWHRRDDAQRHKRVMSPSTASQYSTRQSEISLGILDYYMRDRTSSLDSRQLPPPTPKLDPAIAELDFGELPPTPTPTAASTPALPSRPTEPYQECKGQPLIPISPPSAVRPSATFTRGYSLFPVIKQVTPPGRHPEITHVPPITLRDMTPTRIKSTPSHPKLDPIHRPRKESICSSIRTRNDSINSCRAKQKYAMPLRIVSSDSTTSTPHRRVISSSTATASPPQSRWSDDTIASPSLAPTPGPRTSFGSLLRRDSQQYPACFFEDDDDDDDNGEEAPLRKKWGWKKSVNSVSTGGGDSKMCAGKEQEQLRIKMARYEALAVEMERVLTSPYPAELRTLRQVVLACSDADVSQWAAAKPCAVATLASRVVEALQVPQWSYVLDILTKFAFNVACRDAFLHHEPTLLHRVVAQSVTLTPGHLRSQYAKASVALLSTPLPATVALPAHAQTLFVHFVDNAARSPSPATIEPVYRILRATGSLLLGILSSHVLDTLQHHLLAILRNVSGTSPLTLYCLSIMNTVCCSIHSDPRDTTPTSSTWKSDAMQHFFTGTKAQKSTQLVVLLVLWATKTDTAESCDERTKALVLSLEVLSAIPVDLRKIWCTANPMLVRKLQERLCSEELPSAHKTLALRFVGMLCHLDSLPHPVLESLQATFLEPASMQAVHTLCPHVDHRELLSSILVRAPIGMLLESAVDVATRAESAALAASLDAVTTTIAEAQVVIGSQKIAVHQIRELLGNEEFVGRLDMLSTILSRSSSDLESTLSAGWCQRALSRARCKLAHQISNLLLRASQTAAVGVQAMTVLLDLHALSARGDLSCSHDRPAWRDGLTFGEDHGGQSEHDDIDWREALQTHFTARAQVEQDAVTRLFAKACANLEARCEGVERPLREEQRRCKAAEEQNSQLVQAFAELETRYMDLTLQNRTLEEDRKQLFKDLGECHESLDAAERRGEETFTRVSQLEKQLREAHEASMRQIAELSEGKQIVEVNGAAKLAQKQEQLEDAQDELAALKTRYDNEAVRASDAEQNLAVVRTELDQARQDLTTSISSAQRQQLNVERIEVELQQLKSSNATLEEQLATTSKSDATKMQELVELRDELQACQAELDGLRSEAARETEDLQRELELKRQEAGRLTKQHSEDTGRLQDQISGLHQDLLQTKESLSADIKSRDAKVADCKKRLERYHKKCEQKDQQIAEAESMRANLMAAMGISGTQNRTSLPHRSRESVAPPLGDTQADASPPSPTSASNMDVDASNNDQSFASNASDESKSGPTPKRSRPRKSLSFAAPLTAKPRASTDLRTSRTSIAMRQSMGRQALHGISGNRPSLKPRTPVKGTQKEVDAEEDGSTFEGSELFSGTQDQHLVDLQAAFDAES
ncbi:hypothetical protein AC579_8496 [Pseudocercospora musae]|uniref:Uncharacterized protein n=1 Tax=Pseudocercospora musae TaxID=113226 RepID=A0A139IGD0_9PEZI|nr:hypothetical protein AC579_8496 [Pseudocercospora musae]